jgi:FAD/FMN-containing dehydrogenase/Fe-S oxidoreductase
MRQDTPAHDEDPRGGRELGNAGDLARALAHRTTAEVRFDTGSRALYATDASNYRQVPIGVVLPRRLEDVVETLAVCREYGAPVLARGGGTSLAGQCCNFAVVLDTSKYLNHVLDIDAERRLARVQPGVVLDTLRDQAERHGLTFAPDPATHNHCTLGGMIGNNSCGVHSVMAGKTDDNVHELDVLTYDGVRLRVGPTSEAELAQIIQGGGRRGEIYSRLRALRDRHADEIRARYPQIPRRVSGYNLPWLLPEHGFHVARALVGSECTCVVVLGATVHLVHSPPQRTLLVLGYPDVFQAADDVPRILEAKPVGLEGMDDVLVEAVRAASLHPEGLRRLPPGRGWLLVELGGESRADAKAQAEALMATLRRGGNAPTALLYEDPAEAHTVWKVRESGLGATAAVPGKPRAWEGWEDAAVAPRDLGAYLREFRALLDAHHLAGALYGHFGDGCVHTRISFDLESGPGIAGYRRFVEEASDLVLRYHGSFSGEHGDGQARGELLPKMFGPQLMNAFREFKAIWDPHGKMNPGKLVDAMPLDVNLRLGADFAPRPLETHFHYPEEAHGFRDAALRCVGVGECRRLAGGTMCPSYRATLEEEHSTRGRARLLWEMASGDPIDAGWRSEAVKDSLDLCLACKGCKGECPVHVDMATYKAEFLSHYYSGRLRPPIAYATAFIHWGARLAAFAPGLANAVAQGPLAAPIKALLGLARERRLPRFADQTYRRQHARRPAAAGGKDVLLWVDTFNDHFHPEVLAAAVDSLNTLGYRVRIPEAHLCCGRPLYDWGFVGTAKALLKRTLTALAPDIEAGTPIVGLEPSCVAVFRDELPNLFPRDAAARRLAAQTSTLAELLHRDGVPLPTLSGRAVVHGHCHQKAIMKMDADAAVLRGLGLDFTLLDSGCCGMAGAFGFEEKNYQISMKVGESVLLPAVRAAQEDVLILADGFSCREQIAQSTPRRALHLAQVLQLALRGR